MKEIKEQKKVLIIKPFNMVFLGLCFICALLTIAIISIFKDKTIDEKCDFVMFMYIASLFIFFLYKLAIKNDAYYDNICEEKGMGKFSWLRELPLHLCNIGLIATIIAAIFKWEALFGFVCYISPLGAVLAILMPDVGFNGYSILEGRVMGYFVTHFMVIMASPIIIGLKLFVPSYSAIPTTLLILIVISLIVFAINVIFIKTGLFTSANYMYLMKPIENAVLQKMYELIPYPYFYTYGSMVIVVPWMLLVTFIYKLFA